MLRKILKDKLNLVLILIILFAAFLRLYRIQDYMTFLGDEGRDVLVAYNILHGHFTLLGPTASVGGFYFGPIYYYFMAPFLLLFNYNPVGPAVMVALFGIATVYLVYKIGSTFFNRVTGLIGAFLYAISPIVIAYSRSSWNPNPVPFFSLLVIWFVYKGICNTRNKDFLWAGIFLGIAIELHFIVAILGAVVILYISLANWFATKWHLYTGVTLKTLVKQYLSLGLGFFIGWLPYLGFEVRHGFPNTRNVFAFVFHSGKVSGENTNFLMIIGNVFFRLFARIAAAFPPPEQVSLFPHVFINIWISGILLIAIGSVVLVLWELWSSRGKTESRKILGLLFICLWLVIGVLMFGIYKRQIYEYYFGFMFAVPFLLIANLIVFLWKRNILTKVMSFVCFFSLVLLNLQGIPFRFEPNRQLLQTQTIAKFVNDKTRGEPFNFALITGGNSDHAYRYFFTIWHHEPVTIQNAVIDPQRKTVTNQLLVVCESIPCHPVGDPLWEIAGFGRAEVTGHWNVSVVEVYRLVHYKGK